MRWKNSGLWVAAILVFCFALLSTSPNLTCTTRSEKLLSSAQVVEEEYHDIPTDGHVAAPAAVPEPVVQPRAVVPVTIPATKKYREILAVVTAYCPCRRCCGRYANGRTSTGRSAWARGLASDSSAVPYGTKVFIPGYGMSFVDDTGGAMRRTWRNSGMVHIDVRMTYHWEARRWGRKIMRIQVYDQ